MTANRSDVRPLADPEGELERALIADFLHSRGYDAAALDALPEDQRRRLLEAASVHAAGKLAEVAARAHFIHDVHGDK